MIEKHAADQAQYAKDMYTKLEKQEKEIKNKYEELIDWDSWTHSDRIDDRDRHIKLLEDRLEVVTRKYKKYRKFKPPKSEGKCDVCEGELFIRPDDNRKTILNRLKVFNQKTQPLIDFYAF